MSAETQRHIETQDHDRPALLFLIFNRPEPTQRVFELIRRWQPPRLYIAADGPRSGRAGEPALCGRTREVVSHVDWPCEVHRVFREQNLGCTPAVTSAISWFFEHEPYGIILEDDCLPAHSFYEFCARLLERYATNTQVMHISGSNFIQMQHARTSYYFSHFGSCWGWATWQRAWQHFDLQLPEKMSDDGFEAMLRRVTTSPRHYRYFRQLLDYHRRGEDTIWDWRWTMCMWNQNGLVINPVHNMITNIGYGSDATTSTGGKAERNRLSALERHELSELTHPSDIQIESRIERQIQTMYLPVEGLSGRMRRFVGRILPESIKKRLR